MPLHDPILDGFAALDTAAVSDALDGFGLPPGQGDIVPMWGNPTVVGYAVTIQLAPLTQVNHGSHILTDVVAASTDANVIVIANQGRRDVSSWGGILSIGAVSRGIRAAITDGACRDVAQAREIGFPVYARCAVPATARGRLTQVSANEPIKFGEVVVHAGDVVMADEGGVVIIPRERADEVLGAARAVAARESAIEAEVRAGIPLPQAMSDDRLAGHQRN